MQCFAACPLHAPRSNTDALARADLWLSHSMLQVASFMREALRTLAQCHSHRILHRDVKPGNFMLLSDADNAPLKAIGESLCQG